jgi:hypothetical protein
MYGGGLPPEFLGSLVDFVRRTRSHVATLNYDKLLYGAFLDAGLMADYFNTTLVDGMMEDGFSSETMAVDTAIPLATTHLSPHVIVG